MKNIVSAYTLRYERKSCNNLLREPKMSNNVTNDRQLATIFRDIYEDEGCCPQAKEYCYILLLNKANVPIGYAKVSEGGTDSTVIDMRIAVKAAIDLCATGAALCHNHPSGNPRPGNADLKMTERLKDALRLFDISLIDHIVLGDGNWFSFAESEIKTFTK